MYYYCRIRVHDQYVERYHIVSNNDELQHKYTLNTSECPYCVWL